MQRKYAFVVIMLFSALMSSILKISPNSQATGLPGDSMWMTPEHMLYMGYRTFNITIWFNVTTPTNAWQVYLTYDKTKFNLTRWFWPPLESQWLTGGYTHIPGGSLDGQFQGFHNSTHAYLLVAGLLPHGGSGTGFGALVKVEFQTLHELGDEAISSEFRLDVVGHFESLALKPPPDFELIPLSFGKSTFEYQKSIAPPEIEIIYPQNVTYKFSHPIPLEFTLNESVSWVGYSLNAGRNLTLTENTTLSLPVGSYSLIIYANSTVGNMGCSNTAYFSVKHWGIEVLHVSTNMNNEVQRIIDDVNASNLFTVTQVSLSDFNSGNPQNLFDYDVIVFGVNDGGESRGSYSGMYGRLLELKDYVQFGGGIVWTHDTLEFSYDYGLYVEGPAGVDFSTGGSQFGGTIANVRIAVNHPILHEPFEIGNVGDLIPKTLGPYDQYDHTSGGSVTTATTIIEHEDISSQQNLYLTVNEYSEGRVALIELGHSMGDYGTTLESTKENQILVNAIYWASSPVCDVAVVDVHSIKNGCLPTPTVCRTMDLDVFATIVNQGDIQETFNVTAYLNSTEIGTQLVTLLPGHSIALTFTSNTVDTVEYCVYSAKVYAWPVPSEVELGDNTLIGDTIKAVHMGDVTGDGLVDISDVARVSGAFGTLASVRVSDPLDPDYGKYMHPLRCPTCPHQPNTDVNGDSRVDISDLARTSGNFGWHE